MEYCIEAADGLMKVMRLSHTAKEKNEITLEVTAILDYAQARKTAQKEKESQDSIRDWVADVADADLPGLSEPGITESSVSETASSQTRTAHSPSIDVLTEKPSPQESGLLGIAPEKKGEKIDPFVSLLPAFSKVLPGQPKVPDVASSRKAISTGPKHSNQLPNPVPDVVTNPDLKVAGQSRETESSTKPVGQLTAAPISNQTPQKIKRLIEPKSRRPLTTKERILILKSSKFNGFKFPEWSPPDEREFQLDETGSLYNDSRELTLSPQQIQFFDRWARPPDALPPPSAHRTVGDENSPVMVSTRPADFVQDAGTDCSVVASLCAAIARTDRGHEQMLRNKICPYDEQLQAPLISSNGKYILRLNFNGCWRRVVIDDKLPVSKTPRLLHILDRANPASLWPALVEKAYLKVRGGYDFPGSNSCSDLWALTGWIPEQIYLQKDDVLPDKLWQRIFNGFQYGDVLVTLGTGKMSHRNEREVGLEGQHSYAVLDIKEGKDGEKLFLIKNPWIVGKSGPSAATFWKTFEYVLRHFESLYLNWNPGLFHRREDIHFEWKIPEQKGSQRSLVDNPQFSFISRSAGSVWLLLSRHFRDDPDGTGDGSSRSSDASKGYMCITVCEGGGKRIYLKAGFKATSPYVDTNQVLLQWECEPDTAYTIVVDQEDLPSLDHIFTLSAFANAEITLGPVMDPYSVITTASGVWAHESAGGRDTSSRRYFDNPQFALHVVDKTSLCLMISGEGHEYPLDLKLVHGHGKRIHDLPNRDIITTSGQYQHGCALAKVNDLPAGRYTIICSLFEEGKRGFFSLKAYSTNKVRLEPLPRSGAGLFSKKLRMACFGPEQYRIAVPVNIKRLSRYTFIARLAQVTSPSPVAPTLEARSPIRLSIEEGYGIHKKVLGQSWDGNYKLATEVRVPDLNMDPQSMLEVWNVFVVLDRLGNSVGPLEEWYEVEVLTDMPDAIDASVWREWTD